MPGVINYPSAVLLIGVPTYGEPITLVLFLFRLQRSWDTGVLRFDAMKNVPVKRIFFSSFQCRRHLIFTWGSRNGSEVDYTGSIDLAVTRWVSLGKLL